MKKTKISKQYKREVKDEMTPLQLVASLIKDSIDDIKFARQKVRKLYPKSFME